MNARHYFVIGAILATVQSVNAQSVGDLRLGMSADRHAQ